MFAEIKKFWNNIRGGVNVNAIVGLAVALLVASAILPGAIVAISNETAYTGAPASVLLIVPVLGVVAVAAVLLMIIRSRR